MINNLPIILISSGLPEFSQQVDRPKGLHLSSVISCLLNIDYTNYHYSSEDLSTLGRLFEWAIKEHYKIEYPDQFMDIGAIKKDGIYGTPDLFNISSSAVHEIKFTSKSAFTDIPCEVGKIAPNYLIDNNHYSIHPIYSDKFLYYWCQLAGYVCMINSCNVGVLEICHSRGDYRSIPVVHHRWARKFDNQFKLKYWDMIRKIADENFCYECGERKEKCEC